MCTGASCCYYCCKYRYLIHSRIIYNSINFEFQRIKLIKLRFHAAILNRILKPEIEILSKMAQYLNNFKYLQNNVGLFFHHACLSHGDRGHRAHVKQKGMRSQELRDDLNSGWNTSPLLRSLRPWIEEMGVQPKRFIMTF